MGAADFIPHRSSRLCGILRILPGVVFLDIASDGAGLAGVVSYVEFACNVYGKGVFALPGKGAAAYALADCVAGSKLFPRTPGESRVRFHNLLSGDRYVGLPGERVPTDKCGRMDLSWDKIYIYDYLGLFRRKVREGYGCQVDIFPKPIKAQLPATQSDGLVHAWRPKPGGGFAENREVRLYRPGDNLRHIHWKLTAKTGKLMYAEPIEPVQQGYLLTVCLCGNLEEKLGRLLYFSQNLLSQGITHKIHCRTGDGIVEFLVENPKELNAGFSRILQAKPAETEVDISAVGALWHHHIRGVEMGGAGDEA